MEQCSLQSWLLPSVCVLQCRCTVLSTVFVSWVVFFRLLVIPVNQVFHFETTRLYPPMGKTKWHEPHRASPQSSTITATRIWIGLLLWFLLIAIIPLVTQQNYHNSQRKQYWDSSLGLCYDLAFSTKTMCPRIIWNAGLPLIQFSTYDERTFLVKRTFNTRAVTWLGGRRFRNLLDVAGWQPTPSRRFLNLGHHHFTSQLKLLSCSCSNFVEGPGCQPASSRKFMKQAPSWNRYPPSFDEMTIGYVKYVVILS